MKNHLLVIICGAVLLAAAAAAAEPYELQLQRAQRYEAAGRLEEALQIYQGLLAERPGDTELLARIQGLYKELKWYPQLLQLLQGRLEKDPEDFELWLRLGEALFLSGELQKARETWLEALRLAPRQESSFLQVSNVFLERGMLPEAEEILLRGRQVLQDDVLFADRLARIYELRADYGSATRQYLSWLGQDIRRLSYTDTQLAQFPDEPGVHQAVESALQVAVTSSPDQGAFRHLLSQHLIRMGKPQEAYREVLVLDGWEKSGGTGLLGFATRCAELGHYEVAIQACQEVVARYPDAPTARQAQLMMGQYLVARGDYRDAQAAYRELLLHHPHSAEAGEALFNRGEIFFLYLNDVDSAMTAYQTLVTVLGKGARVVDATFRIADCLAVKGDLEGARAEFDRLGSGSLPQDVKEKAAYKLAELDFLEGDLLAAKEGFDQLVEEFPEGFYVNDALVQSMFLGEGLASDEHLTKAYAGAMRLVHQRRYLDALQALERIRQEDPASHLADDLLLQTALTRERIGQHSEALADLQELLSQYPDSRLCPDALRRMGRLYESRLGDPSTARQIYEKLLIDYPEYLFLDEVRQRLRHLKGQSAS